MSSGRCLGPDIEVRHGSDVPRCERNGPQMFLLAGGTTSSVIVKGRSASGSGGDLGLIRAKADCTTLATGKCNVSSSGSD